MIRTYVLTSVRLLCAQDTGRCRCRRVRAIRRRARPPGSLVWSDRPRKPACRLDLVGSPLGGHARTGARTQACQAGKVSAGSGLEAEERAPGSLLALPRG